MRISTTQFYETTASNYQRTYANVVATGKEVASELKLNTAGDDPVGAARLLQLTQEASMFKQYSSNITATQVTLTQSETAMNSIIEALARAKELVLGGSNETTTDADRKANAEELIQIRDQVLGLMNSKDSSGRYLFSGSNATAVPYSMNPDGSYSYRGDQTSINVPIGDGLNVATNITGWDAFEQAVNTTRTSTTLTSPAVDDGKMALSGGLVASSAAFEKNFAADAPYTITFLSSTQFKITDGNTPPNDVTGEATKTGVFETGIGTQTIGFRGLELSMVVNLTDAEKAAAGTPTDALAGRTYTLASTPDSISAARSPGNLSATTITSAVVSNQATYNETFPSNGAVLKFSSATTFDLYSSPYKTGDTPVSSGTLAGSVATAGGVDFNLSGSPVAAQAGDTYTIGASTHQSQNVLNTLNAVISAFTTPADGNPIAMQKLRAASSSAIGNLASATEQVSKSRSIIGARSAGIGDQDLTNQTLAAENSNNQDTIQKSDPVEAATRLTLQQNMLTASQLVFTQLSKLNLFSKI